VDILSVEPAGGMLFVELMKAMDGWLWCNSRIDNMLEFGLGYSGKLVVERAKDMMENTTNSEGLIVWYG
jgi:hypothetical protein